MLVSDITSLARNLTAEPNTQQRFADPQIIQLIDRAQKMIVRAIRWPEYRYVTPSAVGVQEYQLPEMIRLLRVYVAGQLLERTSIPTLEGDSIGVVDDTANVPGAGGSGLILGGQPQFTAPSATGYGPTWQAQAPLAYPVTQGAGTYTSPAAPWFAGARPRYYMRGGNLGLVPAPAGVYPIVVDCIAQPYTLVNPTDQCVLPDIAADAMFWKTVELMSFSDDDSNSPGSSNARDYAMGQYRAALGDLQAWRRTYDGGNTQGPNVQSLRIFYRGKGQNKAGRRSYRYGY